MRDLYDVSIFVFERRGGSVVRVRGSFEPGTAAWDLETSPVVSVSADSRTVLTASGSLYWLVGAVVAAVPHEAPRVASTEDGPIDWTLTGVSLPLFDEGAQ